MNRRLALLALRRAWTPRAAAAALALAAFAVASQSASSPGAAALAREGVWTLLLGASAAHLLVRSAATVRRWREGELDWLASSPASRAELFASSWLGACGAAALAVALTALCAELSAPAASAPATRLAGWEPAPERGVVDGRESVRWSVAAEPGETLRVSVLFVPVEPFADLELRAARGAAREVGRARVHAPRSLDVLAPAGEGPVELELVRVGGGGLALLDGGRVERLAPARSERAAGLALAAHAALGLAAALALALALGAWLAPALAGWSVAALGLAPWLAGAPFAARWAPWGGLPAALDLAGRGVVPAWPGWEALASGLALVGLSFGLFAAGTREWRAER